MFPELADEFDAADYPSIVIPLQEELDENDNIEYIAEFDRPYGHIKTEIKYRLRDASETDDNFKLEPLPNDLDQYFKESHEPQPISEAKQKEMDEEEEKQNKKKEQDARLA